MIVVSVESPMLPGGTSGISRAAAGDRNCVVIVETDSTLGNFLHRLLSRIVAEVIVLDDGHMLASVAQDSESFAKHPLVVYDTDAGWEPLVEFRRHHPPVPVIVLLSPSAGVNPDA